MSVQATTSTLKALKGTYVLDASHSSLAFVARHAMVTKVRGAFGAFTGEAVVDGANPDASTLKVVVDVSSVSTNSTDRDAHLKSPDFFDVAQYPELTFAGTAFDITDDTTVVVSGDLTIKGVTRPVSITFEFTGQAKDPFGNVRVGFEGRTEVSRKDFGLTWNAALETGGVLVSDKVVLEFDVSAVEQN